jgi:hypothetical protein
VRPPLGGNSITALSALFSMTILVSLRPELKSSQRGPNKQEPQTTETP